MKYNQYSVEQVKEILSNNNLRMIDNNYIDCKTPILCEDNEGYYVYAVLDKIVNAKSNPRRYHKSNNYSIYNINHFAELNNLPSRCISEKYVQMKDKLLFQCNCGNVFSTTAENYLNSHKNKCDRCSNYNITLTYDEVKNNLEIKGFYLEINKEDFHGVTKTDLTCHDDNGYKYNVTYNAVMTGRKMETFRNSNPFTIYNINKYLENHNCGFVCLSECYIGAHEELFFQCKRCGEIINKTWASVNKNDNLSRHHILCPNCDGRLESLHALVLKQVFKHEYPDTIEEEKSCINPKTNKIMPTDIVNHRLKIAVEIESQWHDFPDIQEKDKIKKEFWINKGYKFYNPDIRDYTVLEMCQLFFDINELPDYINYEYSNKINIKKVQELLDNGYNIPQISEITDYSKHRLYDAISSGKLVYPENYKNACFCPVVQLDLDGNYIAEYDTTAEAEKVNNITKGLITSALNYNRTYSSGYNWMRKDDYLNLNK